MLPQAKGSGREVGGRISGSAALHLGRKGFMERCPHTLKEAGRADWCVQGCCSVSREPGLEEANFRPTI